MVLEAFQHRSYPWTYIHGDACPDNILCTEDGVRIIDFEFGHFGNAFLDAANARMLFPSCWCANKIPKFIVDEIERSYRLEIVKGFPELADDAQFETGLVSACAFWALSSLFRHLDNALNQEKDYGPLGVETVRQHVISRLEAFVDIALMDHPLPAMRGTLSRLQDVLIDRWSDTPMMPVYPAFRKL